MSRALEENVRVRLCRSDGVGFLFFILEQREFGWFRGSVETVNNMACALPYRWSHILCIFSLQKTKAGSITCGVRSWFGCSIIVKGVLPYHSILVNQPTQQQQWKQQREYKSIPCNKIKSRWFCPLSTSLWQKDFTLCPVFFFFNSLLPPHTPPMSNPKPVKVVLIHTVVGVVQTFQALCTELLPQQSSVEVFNIVDDSLLADTIKEGHLKPGMKRTHNANTVLPCTCTHAHTCMSVRCTMFST